MTVLTPFGQSENMVYLNTGVGDGGPAEEVTKCVNFHSPFVSGLDFQRLVLTDYVKDGVHLSTTHYRTIRCAVDDEKALAQVLDQRPIPSSVWGISSTDLPVLHGSSVERPAA